MEPRDISMKELRRRLQEEADTGFGRWHVVPAGFFYHDEPVINMAFADGTVRSVPVNITWEAFSSFIRTGGEEFELRPVRPHGRRIIAVAVLGISWALLLFLVWRKG